MYLDNSTRHERTLVFEKGHRICADWTGDNDFTEIEEKIQIGCKGNWCSVDEDRWDRQWGEVWMMFEQAPNDKASINIVLQTRNAENDWEEGWNVEDGDGGDWEEGWNVEGGDDGDWGDDGDLYFNDGQEGEYYQDGGYGQNGGYGQEGEYYQDGGYGQNGGYGQEEDYYQNGGDGQEEDYYQNGGDGQDGGDGQEG